MPVFVLAGYLPICVFAAESSIENDGESSSSSDNIDFLRWQWFHGARFSSNSPANPRLTALSAIKQRAQLEIVSDPQGTNLLWVPIGPRPVNGGQSVDSNGNGSYASFHVSGRIVGISVHPTEPDHWLIASAGGGIWETKDAGKTSFPLTDNMPSMGMGCVVFALGNPSILYAGTSSTDGTDKGFLRSMDAGISWQYLVTSNFSTGDRFTFNNIVVDPEQSSNVVLATSDVNGPYDSTGVFQSFDAGSTWKKRLAGDARCVVAHQSDFAKQYAGIRSTYDSSGSASNGVWRSLDGAATWKQVEGPWDPVANGPNMLIAIAPSQPNTVYVSIGGDSFWRTDNAWDDLPAWTSLILPTGKPAYDVMTVDPANANYVFAGHQYIRFWNGTTWSNITSGTHADQHAAAWSEGRLILGNDGGLWTTTNAGRTWLDHNGSLATIQFYAGAAHPLRPARALAGSQDNGSEYWTGSSAWRFLHPGGDGMDCAFSYQHPDQRFILSAQSLYLVRTTDNGANITQIDAGIESDNRPFRTKIAISPINDDILLTGTTKLWRTTNAFSGSTVRWQTNSPDLFGSVTAIAFAATNGDVYAFGTEFGDLLITTNSGVSWTNPDPEYTLPGRQITSIAFDPQTYQRIYVTYSGFDDSTTGHLFVSTNAFVDSPVWLSVGPPVNLPNNAVLLDPAQPGVLTAATDIGVWRSTNFGGDWIHMGPSLGMPNVVVNDLKLAANGEVLAFTYGRGAFALRSILPYPVFGGFPDKLAIQVFDAGDIELSGTASNAGALILQISTDLEQWSTLQTIIPNLGVFDAVAHPPTSSPYCFFRLIKLP